MGLEIVKNHFMITYIGRLLKRSEIEFGKVLFLLVPIANFATTPLPHLHDKLGYHKYIKNSNNILWKYKSNSIVIFKKY